MAQPPAVDREERMRRRKVFWGQFLLGLAAGVMASALIWIQAWNSFGFLPIAFMVTCLPALKIGVAAFCLVRRHRGFGVGLLLSLPIGFILFADRFVSTCARLVFGR